MEIVFVVTELSFYKVKVKKIIIHLVLFKFLELSSNDVLKRELIKYLYYQLFQVAPKKVLFYFFHSRRPT